MLNNSKTKGFTLVEVLVAIFVLTTGALAAFNMLQNTTISSRLNSSRLTATYLAQEGIELVRNKRDSNWLAGVSWDLNLPEEDNEPMPFPLERFKRTIDWNLERSDKIVVDVKVSWEEAGKQQSIAVQTELYKWLK